MAEAENDQRSTPSELQEKKPFSLLRLTKKFTKCVTKDGTIIIKPYTQGFVEMNKMLVIMGTVFGFVVKELKTRIQKLKELQEGENGQHYLLLSTMLDLEVRKVGIKDRQAWTASGTRHMLNLHRALKFFTLFLEKALPLRAEDNLGPACQEAYDATLAKHHNFLIRGAAKLAIMSLPTKDGLAKNVYGDDPQRMEKVNKEVPMAVAAMRKAYDITKNNFKVTSRCNSDRSMGP